MYYTLLTDYDDPIIGTSPNFVNGYGKEIVQRGASTIIAPSTSKYLWAYLPYADTTWGYPKSIKINGIERLNDYFITDTLEELKKSLEEIKPTSL